MKIIKFKTFCNNTQYLCYVFTVTSLYRVIQRECNIRMIYTYIWAYMLLPVIQPQIECCSVSWWLFCILFNAYSIHCAVFIAVQGSLLITLLWLCYYSVKQNNRARKRWGASTAVGATWRLLYARRPPQLGARSRPNMPTSHNSMQYKYFYISI